MKQVGFSKEPKTKQWQCSFFYKVEGGKVCCILKDGHEGRHEDCQGSTREDWKVDRDWLAYRDFDE